ncbi:MAG: methyltransferase domain-containing protein [Planctomycetes bacterium]|nr:methyltransferase domain-containing protein [Planctomycetota bacterium]
MPTLERPDCPLCKASAAQELYRINCQGGEWESFAKHHAGEEPARKVIIPHFAGQSFSYLKCKSCSFLWQGCVLDDQGMADLYARPEDDLGYAESLRAYQTRSSRQRGTRLAMRVAQTLARTNANITKVKVLDFGCGFGVWFRMAAAMGADCTGVELSEGRRAGMSAAGIRVFKELSDVNESFDLVLSDQVIEHVVDPVQSVKELVSKAKPGAVVFLGTPSSRKASSVIRNTAASNTYNPIRPFIHINSFTNQTLKKIGRIAGLQPIRAQAKYGYHLGVLGSVKNLLANEWDFWTKTAIHFRKA